jgi:hypothetical protein
LLTLRQIPRAPTNRHCGQRAARRLPTRASQAALRFAGSQPAASFWHPVTRTSSRAACPLGGPQVAALRVQHTQTRGAVSRQPIGRQLLTIFDPAEASMPTGMARSLLLVALCAHAAALLPNSQSTARFAQLVTSTVSSATKPGRSWRCSYLTTTTALLLGSQRVHDNR